MDEVVKEIKKKPRPLHEWYPRVPDPAKTLIDDVGKEKLEKMVNTLQQEAIEAKAAEAAEGQEEKMQKDALAIDMLDELQIAEEMRGRVIQQYFYEFQSGGRTVTGIALSGVKAIAHEMAKRGEPITIVEKEWSQGEDSRGLWIGVTVKARDMKTGEERFAFASQSLELRLRDGRTIPDEFARIKALNKAQRNALRWFIPEVVMVQMYRAWKEGVPLNKALDAAAKPSS